MAYNITDAIDALRLAVSDTLGVTNIFEYGNGPNLEAATFPFLAYKFNDAAVENFGPAVLDKTVTVSIDMHYVMKRTAGTESLAALRRKLEQMADIGTAVVKAAAPTASAACGLIHVLTTALGPDDYSDAFMETRADIVAGRVSYDVVCIQ